MRFLNLREILDFLFDHNRPPAQFTIPVQSGEGKKDKRNTESFQFSKPLLLPAGEIEPLTIELNEIKKIITYLPSERIKTNPEYKADTALPAKRLDEVSRYIRTYQSKFFSLIVNTIEQKKKIGQLKDIKGYTLDIPLLDSNQHYFPTRMQRDFETDMMTFYLLENKSYAGQPLFPRLINHEMDLIELSTDLRREIYKQFKLEFDLKNEPINEKPRKILHLVLKRPHIVNSQIATAFGISGKTIAKQTAYLCEIARTYFGIELSDGKHLAKYWIEMGLYLEPAD